MLTDPRYETPNVKATVSHANLEFSEYSVFNFNIFDKLKSTATGLDGLPAWLVSDVDRVERFRLTLRFFDHVSTAS